MSDPDRTYLGDSVYAHTDGNGIVLETLNGLPDDPSNIIYLEREVVESLMRYANELGWEP